MDAALHSLRITAVLIAAAEF